MMRHRNPVITALLVAGLAMSCTPKNENPADDSPQSGTVGAKYDKAIAQSQEAARAIQAYGYARKAEYVNQMKGELAKVQEAAEQLSAKIERANGAVKAEAEAALVALREKWAQAKKQLDQAESATESTWDEVTDGFQKSHGELKDSFDKTRQWFSDKIEP